VFCANEVSRNASEYLKSDRQTKTETVEKSIVIGKKVENYEGGQIYMMKGVGYKGR